MFFYIVPKNVSSEYNKHNLAKRQQPQRADIIYHLHACQCHCEQMVFRWQIVMKEINDNPE